MQEQDWKKEAVENLGINNKMTKVLEYSFIRDTGIESKVRQRTDKRGDRIKSLSKT